MEANNARNWDMKKTILHAACAALTAFAAFSARAQTAEPEVVATFEIEVVDGAYAIATVEVDPAANVTHLEIYTVSGQFDPPIEVEPGVWVSHGVLGFDGCYEASAHVHVGPGGGPASGGAASGIEPLHLELTSSICTNAVEPFCILPG